MYLLLLGPVGILYENGTLTDEQYWGFLMCPAQCSMDFTGQRPEWFWIAFDRYTNWWKALYHNWTETKEWE